jgi:hypothetical protein
VRNEVIAGVQNVLKKIYKNLNNNLEIQLLLQLVDDESLALHEEGGGRGRLSSLRGDS